jgi:ribosomal-protein-alanine N-acetyltransferase
MLGSLGTHTVFLEVDEDNSPARRLYARRQFHQVGERKGYYPRGQGGPTAALILRRDLT